VENGAARSPRGVRYDVVGRAGPIELRSAPYIPAEAREELLVIKEGPLFLCTRPDGEISPGLVSGEGLYQHDTRYLSELRLTIDGVRPVTLSSSAEDGYAAVVDATNPDLHSDGRHVARQQTIHVQRRMLVRHRLYLDLCLRNFEDRRVNTAVALRLGADFADMFEVRAAADRPARGHALAPKRTRTGVSFAYVGEDGTFRETAVDADRRPTDVVLESHGAVLVWQLSIESGREADLLVTVEPRAGTPPRRRAKLATASRAAQEEQRAWEDSCTTIETDNQLFNRVLRASQRDLHALMTPIESGGGLRAVAAGIPWFVALFGRDSLLTSYQTLIANPGVARENLLLLARFQATEDSAWRDAEPGKIMHELRCGELARMGLIPHTPYYGTADATPLFLMLAAAYHRWTDDLETLAELRPALDRALEWIDRHGDRDGDGFVEYQRRSPAGLRNQGWKDSDDCIVHADGSLAEGPIAIVEVQGYVYMAKQRIADVYRALGARDRADELLRQARRLRDAFNDVFWNPDEGTFALALDGQKRRVRSVTSNPGHCLYCGIVDDDKAALVAERLMADDMFCGWGIRTLSSGSPAYNPMSYHNGSVWPHDNAIAAAGLKRYGHIGAAMRVAGALFEVAAGAPDHRLPELYCGFDRGGRPAPVAYPVACVPQAWASAVPYMVLQAMLGVSARGDRGTLTINEPQLPEWLQRVHIGELRVGGSRVALDFRRDGATTAFSLLRQAGEVNVQLYAQAPDDQL
jgi:glycogen debranching enzyme